ncbi:hypothetical protein [Klebsiella oxytoca]|uniref:hypothetical protein n=1 Tax=Klebsiella oxytoca TaxID=571 RepID=UPI002930DDAD|nr:hypothetical protein [Klebsiella oxytoca]
MLRICPGYPTADGGEPWGLPARRRQSTCSPGKARPAPPPEQSAAWLNFPEAMLRLCPGYPTADGGEPWGLPARRRR